MTLWVDNSQQGAQAVIMSLIMYYLAFMVAGDFAAYLLGRFVEYEWGSHASLVVFLFLYFLFLWVAWILAMWASKPRAAPPLAR